MRLIPIKYELDVHKKDGQVVQVLSMYLCMANDIFFSEKVEITSQPVIDLFMKDPENKIFWKSSNSWVRVVKHLPELMIDCHGDIRTSVSLLCRKVFDKEKASAGFSPDECWTWAGGFDPDTVLHAKTRNWTRLVDS